MTAYVYTPYAPVPTPRVAVASGGGSYTNGYLYTLIWGAGIRAGTYPIRIGKIENFFTASLPLYRVDTAAFRNTTLATPPTPVDLRQGSPVPTCTTGMSTATDFMTYGSPYSTYSFAVSGQIPTGTFHYLGTCPPSNSGTAATTTNSAQPAGSSIQAGQYEFAYDLTIQPGSMFWFGSNITAFQVVVNNGTNNYLAYNGCLAGQSSWDYMSSKETNIPVNVYFEEVQEDWTS
jgi:hypothetical protein